MRYVEVPVEGEGLAAYLAELARASASGQTKVIRLNAVELPTIVTTDED